MDNLIKFVSEHLHDETSRLILDRKKWPDTDMELAVNCIESRRKLKGKVQEWYENERLVFPFRLSAEQCSSSDTGRYKASVAKRIAASAKWRIADLTGGLGVDTWFFSKKAETVLYNEMMPQLCEAAAHNFRELGCSNIVISNNAIVPGKAKEILSGFNPDIIYMDPARRGEGGKKVFLIEECTPDILTLKEELFSISRHILVKLSPMADITMACTRLGSHCREVSIVATGGECKELLIWMDREWEGSYDIVAVEIQSDGTVSEFRFLPERERALTYMGISEVELNQREMLLFEPGKALMKSGAFNSISSVFGLGKMAQSTHYYMTRDRFKIEQLKRYGKVFEILDIRPLDKRSIKDIGKELPYAEVTARNIPMDTDTLRKKLGVSSGGNAHIFGLKSDSLGNILMIAQRL